MRAMLQRCTSLLLPLYCAVVAVIAANEAVVLATPSAGAAVASAKAGSDSNISNNKKTESDADATLHMLVTTATIAFAVLHAAAACALLWLHTRKPPTAHATLRSIVYAVLLSCALMHILCVAGFRAVHHLEQRMPLLSARLDRVLLPSQQGSCRAAPVHSAAAHKTVSALSLPTHDGGGSNSSSNKDARQQEEDSTAAAGSDDVLAAAQYMSATPSPSHSSSLTMLDYYDALHVALKTAWQVLLVLFDPLPPPSSAWSAMGGDVGDDAMRSSRLLRRPLWLLSACGFVLVATAAAMVADNNNDTNSEPSARNSTTAVRASTTTTVATTTATNATMADTEAEGRRASAPSSTRTTQTLATDGQRNGKKVQ